MTDLSFLDNIDEENRGIDLNNYLSNQHPIRLSDSDNELDFLDLDSEERLENAPNNVNKENEVVDEEKQSSDVVLKNLALLRRGGTESIEQLVSTIQDQAVQIQTLQLRLSHSSLQMHALLSREKQLDDATNKLMYELALAEQDKLLLEMRIKNIAGFENQSLPVQMDSIRGQLLSAANNKISELTHQLSACQSQLKEAHRLNEQNHHNLEAENDALRKQMFKLSAQLAQRAVLYAAQERRFVDNSRIYNTQYTDRCSELADVKGRLQQLEKQFEVTDRERIEAILQQRQLQQTLVTTQNQLQAQHLTQVALNGELADATQQVTALQLTVDRLRSADLEELEMGFAKEVEELRQAAKSREDSLSQQLTHSRQVLQEVSEQRHSLQEELSKLRNKWYAANVMNATDAVDINDGDKVTNHNMMAESSLQYPESAHSTTYAANASHIYPSNQHQTIPNNSNSPMSDDISLGNSGHLSSDSIAAVLFGEDPSECDTAAAGGSVMPSVNVSNDFRRLFKSDDTSGNVDEREAQYFKNLYETTVKSVEKLRTKDKAQKAELKALKAFLKKVLQRAADLHLADNGSYVNTLKAENMSLKHQLNQHHNSPQPALSELAINGYRDTIAELECQLALQRHELTCCRADLLQLLANKNPQHQLHNDSHTIQNNFDNTINSSHGSNNKNDDNTSDHNNRSANDHRNETNEGSKGGTNNINIAHSDRIITNRHSPPSTPPKSPIHSNSSEELEDVRTKLLIAELNLEMLRGDFDLNLNEVAALQLQTDRLGLEALRKDMLCEDLRSLLLRTVTSSKAAHSDSCFFDLSATTNTSNPIFPAVENLLHNQLLMKQSDLEGKVLQLQEHGIRREQQFERETSAWKINHMTAIDLHRNELAGALDSLASMTQQMSAVKNEHALQVKDLESQLNLREQSLQSSITELEFNATSLHEQVDEWQRACENAMLTQEDQHSHHQLFFERLTTQLTEQENVVIQQQQAHCAIIKEYTDKQEEATAMHAMMQEQCEQLQSQCDALEEKVETTQIDVCELRREQEAHLQIIEQQNGHIRNIEVEMDELKLQLEGYSLDCTNLRQECLVYGTQLAEAVAEKLSAENRAENALMLLQEQKQHQEKDQEAQQQNMKKLLQQVQLQEEQLFLQQQVQKQQADLLLKYNLQQKSLDQQEQALISHQFQEQQLQVQKQRNEELLQQLEAQKQRIQELLQQQEALEQHQREQELLKDQRESDLLQQQQVQQDREKEIVLQAQIQKQRFEELQRNYQAQQEQIDEFQQRLQIQTEREKELQQKLQCQEQDILQQQQVRQQQDVELMKQQQQVQLELVKQLQAHQQREQELLQEQNLQQQRVEELLLQLQQRELDLLQQQKVHQDRDQLLFQHQQAEEVLQQQLQVQKQRVMELEQQKQIELQLKSDLMRQLEAMEKCNQDLFAQQQIQKQDGELLQQQQSLQLEQMRQQHREYEVLQQQRIAELLQQLQVHEHREQGFIQQRQEQQQKIDEVLDQLRIQNQREEDLLKQQKQPQHYRENEVSQQQRIHELLQQQQVQQLREQELLHQQQQLQATEFRLRTLNGELQRVNNSKDSEIAALQLQCGQLRGELTECEMLRTRCSQQSQQLHDLRTLCDTTQQQLVSVTLSLQQEQQQKVDRIALQQKLTESSPPQQPIQSPHPPALAASEVHEVLRDSFAQSHEDPLMVVRLQQLLQTQLAEQRKRLRSRYSQRLKKQHEGFKVEKQQLLELVRRECSEIIQQTQRQVDANVMENQRRSNSNNNSQTFNKTMDSKDEEAAAGSRRLLIGSLAQTPPAQQQPLITHQITQAQHPLTHTAVPVLYPEMLSPELTLQLVHRIVSRSSGT